MRGVVSSMNYSSLAALRDSLLASLQRLNPFSASDAPLPSLPEPYIPDIDILGTTPTTALPSTAMPEKLRVEASAQRHASDAKQSQHGKGDSMEAGKRKETSGPTDKGRDSTSGGSESESKAGKSSSGKETLREKAVKKLHGDGANPTQLGDPISLKNETSDYVPTNEEKGAGKRDSKL